MQSFGYTEGDFMPCEVCGTKAVDIHHIDARGAGGSQTKDYIENLMAVCRKCHVEYGDKKEVKTFLINTHKDFMIESGVKFNPELI
jgi:ribosome-binding protein aMBF1 (putative translation factor)